MSWQILSLVDEAFSLQLLWRVPGLELGPYRSICKVDLIGDDIRE
jgi:hypothetical protein